MYRPSFERAATMIPPQPLDPPAIHRLRDLVVSIMLVVGDLDADVIHEISNLLVEQIACVRRLDLPGVAHMASMERPQTLNAAVPEFLAQQQRDALPGRR